MVPQARREALAQIPDFQALGCCFISHQWDQLTSSAVQSIKSQGGKVFCWTIRNPQQEAKARRISAEAEAYATQVVAVAIAENGLEAAQYQVALKQVEALNALGDPVGLLLGGQQGRVPD